MIRLRRLLNISHLSIAYAVIFRGLGVLATFGLNYVIGKKLGAEQAGIFFQAYSLFMIFTLIASFGLNNTLFIKSSELAALKYFKGIKILLSKSSFLIFILSILLIPLLYLSDDIFNTFLSEDSKLILKIIILALFPYIILNILSETMKAIKEVFWASFFQSFIANTVVFVLAFFLLGSPDSLKDFISGFVIVYWLICIIAYLLLRFKLYKQEADQFKKDITYKEIVGFSKHLFIISVLSTILANFDIIILGKFVDEDQIGIYGMALKVSLIISFILPALNTVYVPMIQNYFVKNDMHQLRLIALKSSKIMTVFTLPLVIVIVAFNHTIMKFFGNEFADSGIILVILVFGQLIRSINASSGFIAMSCGKHKQMTVSLILTFLLHLSFIFLIVPKYGIIGAAIVRTFSMSFQDLSSTWLSKKIIGITPVYGLYEIKKLFKRIK